MAHRPPINPARRPGAADRRVTPAMTEPENRGKLHLQFAITPVVPREKPNIMIQRLTLMAVAAAAIAAPAQAQLIAHKDLSASMALTIAETALSTCTASGYRVSVAVLGRNAEPLVQVRGDGSSPHTFENSFRKAYTARTFRIASGEIAKRFKDDPSYFAVRLTSVIPAEGGLPIKVGDDVIGSVGVSGAPGGEKDAACGQAGIDKVAGELK